MISHYFVPQGKPGVSSLLFLLAHATIEGNNGGKGKARRGTDPKTRTGKKIVYANQRIINLAMLKKLLDYVFLSKIWLILSLI